MWGSTPISLSLSIIIPVLNEADIIEQRLRALQPLRDQIAEIILVDGGSDDATVTLAKPWVDLVLFSDKGRARQMNLGASHACSELLMFLHIDTAIDSNHIHLIRTQLRTNNSWARFNASFDDRRWIFSLIAFGMNLRSRITGIATGDQAITVRKTLFESVDGYPDLALMEDIALCRKLRRIARPVCFEHPVITSARRWRKYGILKTIIMMWYLRLAYFMGISPERLHGIYERP